MLGAREASLFQDICKKTFHYFEIYKRCSRCTSPYPHKLWKPTSVHTFILLTFMKVHIQTWIVACGHSLESFSPEYPGLGWWVWKPDFFVTKNPSVKARALQFFFLKFWHFQYILLSVFLFAQYKYPALSINNGWPFWERRNVASSLSVKIILGI